MTDYESKQVHKDIASAKSAIERTRMEMKKLGEQYRKEVEQMRKLMERHRTRTHKMQLALESMAHSLTRLECAEFTINEITTKKRTQKRQ